MRPKSLSSGSNDSLQLDVEASDVVGPSLLDDAFEPDVDLDAVCRNRSRTLRLTASTWYPRGPSSLEDILRWPEQFLTAITAYDTANGTSLVGHLVGNLQQGIVLTTSCSGKGCAETAAFMISKVVSQSLPNTDLKGIVSYSCSDSAAHCT